MKKFLFSLTLLLLHTYILPAQNPPSVYTPISFAPEAPEWIHVLKDTNRGGPDSDDLEKYLHIFVFKDFEVRKKELFLLNESIFNNKGSGFHLEKVNLINGASIARYSSSRIDSFSTFPLDIIFQKDDDRCHVLSTTYRNNHHSPKRLFLNSTIEASTLKLIDEKTGSPQDSFYPGVDDGRFDLYVHHTDTSFFFYEDAFRRIDSTHFSGGIKGRIVSQSGKTLWDTTVYYEDYPSGLPFYPNSYPLQLIEVNDLILGILSYTYFSEDSMVAHMNYYDHRLNLIERHNISFAFDDETIFGYIKYIDKNYIYVGSAENP